MTFQQFLYVVKIAETGSFSAASKELFITQPALSKAVMELEEELNTTLFIREKKGVRLTEKGSKFLVYANQAIDQLELIKNEFNSENEDKKIFSVGSQHYNFVVEAFAELLKKRAGASYDFAIKEVPTSVILNEVKTGQLEIGLIYMSKFNNAMIKKSLKDAGLVYEFIFRARPHVCINKSNELSLKKTINFSDIENMPRIRYEQRADGSFYFFEELYSNLSSSKNIVVSDRGTLAYMLEKLNAYTISTGILSDYLEELGTVAVPLECDEYIDIGFIYIQDKTLSPIAKQFMELTKLTLAKHNNAYL